MLILHYFPVILFAQGIPGVGFNPVTFGPDGNLYTSTGPGVGANGIEVYNGTTGAFRSRATIISSSVFMGSDLDDIRPHRLPSNSASVPCFAGVIIAIFVCL